MPRKRSMLPKECPLCGRKDGTFQYVIFNNENSRCRHAVICRIGHYDKNRYASTRGATNSKLIKDKIKWPSGRIWHSFKCQPPFKFIVDGEPVRAQYYFDAIGDEPWLTTSRTVKPDSIMYENIRNYGWNMTQLLMRRRTPKEYPKPQLGIQS